MPIHHNYSRHVTLQGRRDVAEDDGLDLEPQGQGHVMHSRQGRLSAQWLTWVLLCVSWVLAGVQ